MFSRCSSLRFYNACNKIKITVAYTDYTDYIFISRSDNRAVRRSKPEAFCNWFGTNYSLWLSWVVKSLPSLARSHRYVLLALAWPTFRVQSMKVQLSRYAELITAVIFLIIHALYKDRKPELRLIWPRCQQTSDLNCSVNVTLSYLITTPTCSGFIIPTGISRAVCVPVLRAAHTWKAHKGNVSNMTFQQSFLNLSTVEYLFEIWRRIPFCAPAFLLPRVHCASFCVLKQSFLFSLFDAHCAVVSNDDVQQSWLRQKFYKSTGYHSVDSAW